MRSLTVYVHSASPHTDQAFTGVDLLDQAGVVRAKYVYGRQGSEWSIPGGVGTRNCDNLFLETDRQELIYIDLKDGKQVDQEALEVCKVYFKRSYRPGEADPALEHKVWPWGLHYEVCPDRFTFRELRRTLQFGGRGKRTAVELARQGGRLLHLPRPFSPAVSAMWAPPRRTAFPKVLFNVRAWSPDEMWNGRPLDKVDRDEREELLRSRVECLRRLKKALGDRFVGGLYHNAYSMEHYPDLLLPSKGDSGKGAYISTLRDCDICVATVGLHESIGWKFAEYIAFSKAIVTEPLRYVPSGDLADGRHYLSFRDAGECYQRIMELVESPDRRHAMMVANAEYFRRWLHPARLVQRALDICARLPDVYGPEQRRLAEG